MGKEAYWSGYVVPAVGQNGMVSGAGRACAAHPGGTYHVVDALP